MPTPSLGSPRLTAVSLAALIVGLGLGIVFHASQAQWVTTLVGWLGPVGALWVRVLNLLVIPLIISLAVVAALNTPGMGRLGRRAVLVFSAMLAGGALLMLLVAPPIVALVPTDPEGIAALRAGIPVPEAAIEAVRTRPGFVEWLQNYVPAGLDSIIRGALVLVVLLGAILVALGLRRFAGAHLPALSRGVQWLADAIQYLVRAILLVTPIAIFALSFQFGLSAGGRAAGFLATYVAIVAGILLFAIGLLYPLTALLAKTTISRFARAAAPAQLVAVGTQSSIAALPAMIEGGRAHLGFPDSATGFVLPLSVAIFKLNRTISGPVQLLLLTHVFGTPLSAGRFALFIVASFLQSFFTPGVPGGGTPYFTLPLYVAAGAPIEGVVLVATVDPLVDVFKTLTNVTADMSAAAIVGGVREVGGVGEGGGNAG